MLFFFNDPATTEIYTLSLHDALPICEGLVLADEVVARRVRALDRVLLDRVADAERRDDLARGEDADLEFPARELANALGDDLGAAVDGVEALREARGATPADLRKGGGLRDGLGDGGRACHAHGAAREELASVHRSVLLGKGTAILRRKPEMSHRDRSRRRGKRRL